MPSGNFPADTPGSGRANPKAECGLSRQPALRVRCHLRRGTSLWRAANRSCSEYGGPQGVPRDAIHATAQRRARADPLQSRVPGVLVELRIRADNFSARCPEICSGTPAATAGCAAGGTDADSAIDKASNRYGEQEVIRYLRSLARRSDARLKLEPYFPDGPVADLLPK